MDNKLGVLLAFALGAIVAHKWPTIAKTLTPLASKLQKALAKDYLALKDGFSGVSSHFRKVADEVRAEAKAPKGPRPHLVT